MITQVPLGIGIAVSIRVGNELGAGNPKAAKRASYVALGMACEITLNCKTIMEFLSTFNFAVSIATINTILLQLTKNHIGKIFTKDELHVGILQYDISLLCIFHSHMHAGK